MHHFQIGVEGELLQPGIEIEKLSLQEFIKYSSENFNHCNYDLAHNP